MTSLKKYIVNFNLFLKESKSSIFIIIFWFLFGFIFYYVQTGGQDISKVIMYTFYIETEINGTFDIFYQFVGSIVILQGVFSVLLSNSFSKHNPIITSRKIARGINKEHVVIIHYGHIGQRITNFFKAHKKKYIVIEKDPTIVKDLLDKTDPVIVGDPSSQDILKDANLDTATAVFICTNNVEDTIMVIYSVRGLNPNVKIYARMFDDRLKNILENKPYYVKCFSTSKTTIDKMRDEWILSKKGAALIIDVTNFTKVIAKELLAANREVIILDTNEDDLDYFRNLNVKLVNTDPEQIKTYENKSIIDMDKVEQIFIGSKEEFSKSVVIGTNLHKRFPNIEIYVRVFNDKLAQFLELNGIKTFSTSKFTFNLLKPDLNEVLNYL